MVKDVTANRLVFFDRPNRVRPLKGKKMRNGMIKSRYWELVKDTDGGTEDNG